jgi:dTDP-glucose 4,6-dehydratase
VRILVTGAAGFIGSHYVRSLLAYGPPGVRVTALDALTHAAGWTSLDDLAGESRLTRVTGDVVDARLVAEVVPGHDAVVHVAAESHVDTSIRAPARFVRSNVAGTQVLLDAARRYGVGRFLQVSTDEVYGSVESGSWTEAAPLAPSSPYAASKAAADLLVLAACRTYGLDAVVTRCANNYGPYQLPEKVIPRFVTNLLRGGAVPLYGDGKHIREWLHVTDHCTALGLVLAGGRAGAVYHIGGGTALTNEELTGRLLELCGAGWDRVRRVADRPGHDRRYALDDSRIRDELGYRPVVDFETGLADTVRWYAEHPAWWAGLVCDEPST